MAIQKICLRQNVAKVCMILHTARQKRAAAFLHSAFLYAKSNTCDITATQRTQMEHRTHTEHIQNTERKKQRKRAWESCAVGCQRAFACPWHPCGMVVYCVVRCIVRCVVHCCGFVSAKSPSIASRINLDDVSPATPNHTFTNANSDPASRRTVFAK